MQQARLASGKVIRMSRILSAAGRVVIVALDHAVSLGPIRGLESLPTTSQAVWGGADALLVNRGIMYQSHLPLHPTRGLILHLSAGTRYEHGQKAVVATVEDALCLGADAVSIQIHIGGPSDRDYLRDLSVVSSACDRWGMPLLVMAYPYHENSSDLAEKSIHAARIAAEMGADLVKVNLPEREEDIDRLVHTCFAPIVISGGQPKASLAGYLKKVEKAISSGVAGVCIGRTIFQSSEPDKSLASLRLVVHGID